MILYVCIFNDAKFLSFKIAEDIYQISGVRYSKYANVR